MDFSYVGEDEGARREVFGCEETGLAVRGVKGIRDGCDFYVLTWTEWRGCWDVHRVDRPCAEGFELGWC